MRIVSVWMGLVVFCTGLHAAADGYQTLYQAAGWAGQRDHFQEALHFAQQRYQNSLPAPLFQALVANSNQRFAAANMDQRALATLRQQLPDPQPALRFYQSAVGQKVVAAELQASDRTALLRHANGVPVIAVDPSRQSLMQNLAQHLPVQALGAEFSLALASIAADSLSQMMPGFSGLFSGGQTQTLIEGQRQRFMSQMDVDATLRYLYQSLSNAELNEYLQFAQSPQGQAYYQAALQAVRAALGSEAL